MTEGFWGGLFEGFLLSLVYGALGITLAVGGFKAFDWVTPKIDIQGELAEKHNIAVAIVCAAIILGVCYIVAAVTK